MFCKNNHPPRIHLIYSRCLKWPYSGEQTWTRFVWRIPYPKKGKCMDFHLSSVPTTEHGATDPFSTRWNEQRQHSMNDTFPNGDYKGHHYQEIGRWIFFLTTLLKIRRGKLHAFEINDVMPHSCEVSRCDETWIYVLYNRMTDHLALKSTRVWFRNVVFL